MMARRGTTRFAGPRGITLVEVVMSLLIVSVMLVAALRTVGASRTAQRLSADHAVARGLAMDLLSEILQQAYLEPDDMPDFGVEGSETTVMRANWDDVDDYHGWSASPPQDRRGESLPNRDGWRRRVNVEWIKAEELNDDSSDDRGMKRITVTVERNGVPRAEYSGWRSVAWRTSVPDTPRGGSENTPPIAVAGASPRRAVTQPAVVAFDGSNSSDPDGGALRYDWDFGDGGGAAGIGPSHSYAAGAWTATLTVTDSDGAIDIDVIVIVVEK